MPLRGLLCPVLLALGCAAKPYDAPDAAAVHDNPLFLMVAAVLLAADFVVVSAAKKLFGT